MLLPRLLYIASEDRAFLSHRLPMAQAARRAGFDVHVATSIGLHADAIRAEGFTLHEIPFRRGSLSPLASLSTILSIRNLERRIGSRIVHRSGLQCCVLGGFAEPGTATPQINAFTGLGYVFTGTTIRARVLRLILAHLLRYLLNRDHIISLVQNPDDREMLKSIGIRTSQIALIPGSGVDTDLLQPLPEPDGPITVGFAGRLLADKGIRALVAAHRILRARGLDIQLIVAGEPDPANPASVSLEEITAWAKEPGISLLGHIDDIVSLWRRSHIAVLPSHREGLPKSLLEAAACGRPMVATDAPGCREIVLPNETGLLVPIEAPEALADAISELSSSVEMRAKFGAAARDLVVQQLSSRKIGEETVKLYRQLLGDAH